MLIFTLHPCRATHFFSTAKRSVQERPISKQISTPSNYWLLCQIGNKQLPAIKDCLVQMSIS
ncbi:MAG: hypothetical protein ACSHXM_03495, partial [Paraglaciecola sp.]